MKTKILKIIANLNFSIILLLIISLVSIVGTVIEQDQNIEFYKLNYPLTNQLFGFLSWNIILKLELDHIYKTWWFISLIFIFGVSLSTCSVLQQLPAFRIARRCQFLRTIFQFQQLKIYRSLKQSNISKLVFKLKTNNYSIFQQKNLIYCYQGLVGRIAPILVHFSMITVLVGTVIGSLLGFNGQESIPKTETFHIQNIFSSGKLTKFPILSSRINDFWILYKDQNTIDQFYSNISILNLNGEETIYKTGCVNSPVKYNSLDFYQTNWNLIGLRFQTQNLQVQYPLTTLNKVWLTWLPLLPKFNDGFTVLINNLQGYCSIYSKTGKFLGNLELNETFPSRLSYTLIDIISSDGLQIKIDPGIKIIYFGFFWLMITSIISYKSYSQIWLLKNNSKIFIGGNTTRALFQFEFEFFKLIK